MKKKVAAAGFVVDHLVSQNGRPFLRKVIRVIVGIQQSINQLAPFVVLFGELEQSCC